MRPATIDTLTSLTTSAMARDDWSAAEEYGRRLDDLEARRPAPQLLASALWYADQGMPVFPLQPGSKKPLRGSRGFKDATCDADQIRAWWDARPDANIGLATGHRFDVIDIDGPTGQRSRLDNWEAFTMPFLGMVATPRPGGLHLYVPVREGASNGSAILPGIDYRGLGGYVVAPPSRVAHAADPDVKHDGDYHWIAPYSQQHQQCRLHGSALRPEVCWTCREMTKASEAA